MDSLVPLSHAVLGLLPNAQLQYLNDGTLVYASGNGLVMQDVETGAQVG